MKIIGYTLVCIWPWEFCWGKVGRNFICNMRLGYIYKDESYWTQCNMKVNSLFLGCFNVPFFLILGCCHSKKVKRNALNYNKKFPEEQLFDFVLVGKQIKWQGHFIWTFFDRPDLPLFFLKMFYSFSLSPTAKIVLFKQVKVSVRPVG